MQFDRKIIVLNQNGSAYDGEVFGFLKKSSCNIVFTANGFPSIHISGWDFYDCYLKLNDALQEHHLKILCKDRQEHFSIADVKRYE